MSTEKKCSDRVRIELRGRVADLRQFRQAAEDGKDEASPDLGRLAEYGLAFDYVSAGTFSDQETGYFRWQLSWGGPSDEFRFFTDAEKNCHRVEYWFMDWYDGAKVTLSGKQKELLLWFFDWFDGMDALDTAMENSK